MATNSERIEFVDDKKKRVIIRQGERHTLSFNAILSLISFVKNASEQKAREDTINKLTAILFVSSGINYKTQVEATAVTQYRAFLKAKVEELRTRKEKVE